MEVGLCKGKTPKSRGFLRRMRTGAAEAGRTAGNAGPAPPPPSFLSFKFLK